MPPLPSCTGLQAIRALEGAGFIQLRQKGSHVAMQGPGGERLVVPAHRKDLRTGTLRAIIRQSGLSVAEFTALMKGR